MRHARKPKVVIEEVILAVAGVRMAPEADSVATEAAVEVEEDSAEEDSAAAKALAVAEAAAGATGKA